jgi:hypothetical protein
MSHSNDLSPLGFAGAVFIHRKTANEDWSRRGSNPQPLHCERSALPIELRPL